MQATMVPCGATRPACNRAPIRRARWFIVSSPMPATAEAPRGIPTPLSRIRRLSLPIAKTHADADSISSSVRERVAHRLLGDAIVVRLDGGVKSWKTTIAGEGARDRVKRLDIRRQDLQRGGEPHLREAARIEAAREVAGVADRLLQQCGDLRCGRRRRIAAPGQLAGEGRAQRGDAGQVLAQAVMKLAPHAPLFPITGLDQRSFKPLLAGDVARRRANRLPLRREDCVPLKPPIGTVLAPKAILIVDGCWARRDPAHLRRRVRAVVGVDEIEEGPGQKIIRRPAYADLRRRVDALKAAIEANNARQVMRQSEEKTQFFICWPKPGRRPADAVLAFVVNWALPCP